MNVNGLLGPPGCPGSPGTPARFPVAFAMCLATRPIAGYSASLTCQVGRYRWTTQPCSKPRCPIALSQRIGLPVPKLARAGVPGGPVTPDTVKSSDSVLLRLRVAVVVELLTMNSALIGTLG